MINDSKDEWHPDGYYNKSIYLILLSNTLNFGLFSYLNIKFSYLFIVFNFFVFYFFKFSPLRDAHKNKLAINFLLMVQALIMCIVLPVKISSLFFLISTIFTLSIFKDEADKKCRQYCLGFSIANFLFWNFYKTSLSVEVRAEDLNIINVFFRIDIFLFSIFSFLFWIEQSEKMNKKISAERSIRDEILNNIPIPILCKNVTEDFKIVYCNKAAADYWNLDQQTLGVKDAEVYGFDKETLGSLHELDLKCAKELQKLITNNFKVVENTGSIRYFNVTKIPITSNLVITIAEDFTAGKYNQALIEYYKFALDASAIISFSDEKGVITFANEKFCEISGYSQVELLGKNHRIIKSGIHDDEIYKTLWETIASGKIWQGEICNKKKDGDLYWTYATIVPGRDAEGVINQYFSIRFDITDRKDAELRLIQSDKLSVLGEMAAGIFHEINNPLAILSAQTGILHKGIKKTQSLNIEKIEKGLGVLEENIERIVRITKGLKSYSRNAQFDPFMPAGIVEIIESALTLSHDKLKKHQVEVLKDFPFEEIFISCRVSEIAQILINLINNSVDAIESLPNKWIRIALEIRNNQLKLSITDSGAGIPLEIVSKMMTPFYTTKPLGLGTGLGLSISMNIIKAHSGILRYDDKKENTTFIIEMPILDLAKDKSA